MRARIDRRPLSRRWLAAASVIAFVVSFAQSPGRIAADTKYDLTENPLGFLGRAAHLWSSQAPTGQVQNQAYGYFFPHGAFFALGDLLSIPAWITQRAWWAVLLIVGFWGIVRLAEAIGVGSRTSRVVAAAAFALSPRVVTTLGSISSETLPMMLAPWVLLPVVVALRPGEPPRSMRSLAARSAVAVALMGAVNAVATLAACLVAVVWWLAHRPSRRWWVFTGWWALFVALAVAWWIVPLLLLGSVSPPFLDYIESSGVTTQWASLGEILRGTGSWTPFVSPERIAGAVLVTQPAAVVATGVVAAAGLAGLAMRAMPARGRLVFVLFVGLAGLSIGYVGELAGPFAESVRVFLDGAGAPLRNVHKLEPLVRLPIALGLAHLLARVPLPGSVPTQRWRSALAHPEREKSVAFATLVLVALVLSTSLVWTGKLAPRGTYTEVPQHWHDAAQWLEDHASGDSPATSQRALVAPGAPFGIQTWGLTRDEPLQALASTPWTVRDSVPLTPPGAIRAMDSVQRLLVDGRPSDGLARTLLGQGISYLVVRNDLDPETSRSARPMLVHQAVNGSPGFEKVAEFGDPVDGQEPHDVVEDGDLRPAYPAVEIYRVGDPVSGETATVGPYTSELADVARVQGGPESLLRLHESDAIAGPVLTAADAARAGLPVDDVLVTDTPRNRETDYGQVDNHSSGLRSPDEPRRTFNEVPDYAVPDTPRVEGEWSGATITTSSSASDATQLGGAAPGASAAATVDGDPATGWFSNLSETARGQWLRVDLDHPVPSGLLHITTSPNALGPPVKWMEVSTPNGSTAVKIDKPGEPVTVSLPGGSTPWVQITAMRTENGSAGVQFGISDVQVEDFSDRAAPVMVPIEHRTALPPTPDGARVDGWHLSQEFPGRRACADAPDRVRCGGAFPMPPEEGGTFERTLSVPDATTVSPGLTVRAHAGARLEELLADPSRASATGPSDVADLRGAAFAATDGDVRTAWTAQQKTVGGSGPLPTLTIELPEPTEVAALDLAPSLGKLPAAPTRVAVDLGSGTQVRDVEDDRVDLEPHVTQRIVLSLVSSEEVWGPNPFGYNERQPGGVAEVTVLGPDGQPVAGSGPRADAGARVVTVPCETGPTLRVGEQTVRLSVSGTVDDLLAGRPVAATACDPAPLALAQGRVDVSVDPTPAFFVDALDLRPDGGAVSGTGAQRVPADTTTWSNQHREVTVDAQRDQLLVVPESTNVGWKASAPDGSELVPVVVDGWQQGWVLPAGTHGTVTLEYTADTWYRGTVFGGLALLIPLLVSALWPSRRPRGHGAAPRPWRSTLVALLGVLATTGIVAGVPGVVTTLVVAAGAALVARTRGKAVAARGLVVLTGLAGGAGFAVLSTGPWRSSDGYVGHSFWVQFPLLVALAALGVAVAPASRLLIQRLTARRAGSSTKA
ncbi:DUF3367 domain-containing protein [Rhodococcus sp. HNM0569]|uniref:DUF3367 domain-containing protein n=1 Tax=Rhodococcus sp. HNM0569 TaxID=2716340 RepID=UPI0019818326|nr:DUF3367 domain-containing protein [Rhodococcus sp. HNM0569]